MQASGSRTEAHGQAAVIEMGRVRPKPLRRPRPLDAAMNLSVPHWGVDAGPLSRGLSSGALTVPSVAVCAAWGRRRMRCAPGVVFRVGPPMSPPTAAR